MGILNLMARKNPGFEALKAILVFNIIGHFLSMAVDAYEQ